EEDLRQYIASHPAPDQKVRALEVLVGMEFRAAQYEDALLHARQILSLKPDAQDIANFLPTLDALAPFVRQTVISRRPSSVRFELFDQNLVLPLTIGKVSANYILDNGFSLSGMTESEAKRLKLTVKTVSTHIDTMSGASVGVRIAVVPELAIGGLHLGNVAFYIVPDEQPPFNQLPSGHRGILGLQVVLALEHFAWQPGSSTFTIYRNRSASSHANLAFDGSSILARLSFHGTPIDMSLDLGAVNTILYPSFARQFPNLEKEGLVGRQRVTGVGGSALIESFTLPSADFELGGKTVTLKPATVLLEDNNSTTGWFRGNLGMNLLNEASSADVDFRSM